MPSTQLDTTVTTQVLAIGAGAQLVPQRAKVRDSSNPEEVQAMCHVVVLQAHRGARRGAGGWRASAERAWAPRRTSAKGGRLASWRAPSDATTQRLSSPPTSRAFCFVRPARGDSHCFRSRTDPCCAQSEQDGSARFRNIDPRPRPSGHLHGPNPKRCRKQSCPDALAPTLCVARRTSCFTQNNKSIPTMTILTHWIGGTRTKKGPSPTPNATKPIADMAEVKR